MPCEKAGLILGSEVLSSYQERGELPYLLSLTFASHRRVVCDEFARNLHQAGNLELRDVNPSRLICVNNGQLRS